MTKLLLVLALTATIAVMPVLAQDAGTQDQATPEDLAWDQVDGMGPATLEGFLKKFPNGKHAKKAQLYLSFHKKIPVLQNQQEHPDSSFPSANLGNGGNLGSLGDLNGVP